jgi:hypothetical protein
MKRAFFKTMLAMTSFIVAQSTIAGPLVEKYREEQASAIGGALTAQLAMHPFNPSDPFVSHYSRIYANDGQVRPVGELEMVWLKSRLIWEYGPLSAKAFSHAAHLNDAVLAVVYEKPELLLNHESIPYLFGKIRNLQAREGTFHGNQADMQEARVVPGLRLPSNPRDEFVDLEDSGSKNVFQGKVYADPLAGLKKANEDFFGYLKENPRNAKNYYYLAPKDQIEQLISSGELKPTSSYLKFGLTSSRQEAPVFVDRNTGLKVVAYHAEPDEKSFRQNFREAYSLEKRLSLRPAGFGNASVGGFLAGSGLSLAAQIYQGQTVDWTSVGESGGIGLASGAATVLLAQQIEQRFGKELAQSFVVRNLLPGLGRGAFSGAAASTVVGGVVVLGFVAKDYFPDQITFNEAVIQTGIGLGSVGVGVGAGVIATWATTGTLLGSEVPIVGNIAGFLVGLGGGTIAYLGGEWYYENFKLEGILAERREFAKTAAKWNAEKLDQEIKSLHQEAAALRTAANQIFH